MGQAPPPGMRDEIKRQQDLEKQLGGAIPPGGRVVEGGDGKKPPPPKKQGPDPIKELKKNLDKTMREMGKETEGVKKRLESLSNEASINARVAADEATRAAGGETKRDKLDRLFAADADEVPTGEALSDFERFLENRRKGKADSDFYAEEAARKQPPAADDAGDDDWLGKIKYQRPK
mmetsp:Transcript_4158/g.12940  ORF Transcript_4158/g.12940 Transcript_4158/m.12940 type:complete len:177 (-) Transcript_4158:59-589(-)